MKSAKTILAGIAVGIAIVASASPGLAKERAHSRHATAHRPLYNQAAPQGGYQGGYLSSDMNGSRAAALRECNKEVEPWNNRDWQSMQIIRYNGCMQQHGQMP